MKMKTNKLLTLTLATGLVAMTAGCGASKTPAATTGGGNGNGNGTPPPTITITNSDWISGATQAADLDNNGFLAGNTAGTGLTLAPSSGVVVETLTLNSTVTAATTTSGSTKGVSAITLGGEAADGVAFFTNPGATPATTGRYFAGLLGTTNLGGPITSTIASNTATWNGLFEAIGDTAHTTATSFTLNVNFADNEISAHIAAAGAGDVFGASNNSYYLEATFNVSTGLITGDIIFGGYAAADAPASLLLAEAALEAATATGATGTATNGRGTVTGLIGAQGVLGAFHSNGTDGDGALGFAGGFVATTVANAGGIDPDAIYSKWSGSDDVTLATTLDDNGFLASVTADADGLDVPTQTPAITPTFTTLNLNSPTHAQVDAQPGVAGTGPRTLGGAATSGVAFFSNPGTTPATDARYFAGLHFGTDLGAPVTTVLGSAEWNGLIQTISGTAAAQFDAKVFRLSVNFVDSEVSAHVTTDTADSNFGIASYYLTGEYDDAGVITGTVSYSIIPNTNDGRTAATGNGTLSGLISETNAVGAFYSTAGGAAGYAGGFVARSTAIPAGAVIPAGAIINYADWVPTTPAALTAAATTLATAPTGNAFVHGVAAGLSLPSAITATPLGLDEGTLTGDATNGVAFGMNGATTAARFYAGVLNGTTLGAPVTSTATGDWVGYFEAVGGTNYATAARSITVAVNFTGTTFSAHVPAGASSNADTFTTAGSFSYYLAGTFDATTGLVTGEIIHGDYSTTPTTQMESTTAASTALGVAAATGDGRGNVTGLIGATGLVGAFISNATGAAAGYAGGFVAAPPAPGS